MKYQKVVILVALFLFIAPFVYGVCPTTANCAESAEGTICSTEEICAGGSWRPPTPAGQIFTVMAQEIFDVVSNGNVWYGCDSENNGLVTGVPIIPLGRPSTDKIIAINSNDFICYTAGSMLDNERLAKCTGFAAASPDCTRDNCGVGDRIGNVIPADPYYYCSNTGRWTEIGNIGDLAERKTVCDAASGFYPSISWTGTKCCGDERNPTISQIYYSDLQPWVPVNYLGGGCWNRNKIESGNRVNDTNLAPNYNWDNPSPDWLPDKWERNGLYPINNGRSQLYTLETEKYYIIDVPVGSAGDYYGLKSEPISVRKNTEYILSIEVQAFNVINNFVALNLYCNGDGTLYDYSWGYSPDSRTVTGTTNSFGTTNGFVKIYAPFKTTDTTTDCQILPMFNNNAYGTVHFKNIKLAENNPYILNYEGQFYACGKDNDYFGLPPGIVSNINEMCTAKGNYLCSENGWAYSPGAENENFHASPLIPGANLLVNPNFS